MSINLSASSAGHFKMLDEALKSFDEKNKQFKLCASGHSLKFPIRFKKLSPLLSDIIDPLTEIDLGRRREPTVILPDCSPVILQHLHDLLIKGCTTTYYQEDVKDCITDLAEILGMDIKNLVHDEQQLEDGEIFDGEERRDELNQEDDNGVKVLKIASFATADIFNPNIVNYDKANNNPPQNAEIVNLKNTHKFKCPDCSVRFLNEASLLYHLKIRNHGENPFIFKCELCNYAGRKQGKLNRHMLTHNSEKSFKCEICDYAGTNQAKLNKHSKKHLLNTVKSLKCKWCEYEGTNTGDLNKHSKKHILWQ